MQIIKSINLKLNKSNNINKSKYLLDFRILTFRIIQIYRIKDNYLV